MAELAQVLVMIAVPASIFAFIGCLNRRGDRLYDENRSAERTAEPR
ncbi:hypothetical protein [Mycolicibacterium komossense]|uniref:Uncharacterized protein n=1 Tax=Mycolicibacterium komossense TaxID=1779 RepID=A0ABT3CED6_9MYCO|nr:hypothetical protein [Mycolicibacterium komossense]MCV7227839.1 hypothetical protein [Mycolicibacterium komossense]